MWWCWFQLSLKIQFVRFLDTKEFGLTSFHLQTIWIKFLLLHYLSKLSLSLSLFHNSFSLFKSFLAVIKLRCSWQVSGYECLMMVTNQFDQRFGEGGSIQYLRSFYFLLPPPFDFPSTLQVSSCCLESWREDNDSSILP